MDDDLIDVNCGYCGDPLRISLGDLGDARTVACARCAQLRDAGEVATRIAVGKPVPKTASSRLR